MSEQAPNNPSQVAQRAAELAIDRQVEAKPLPYSAVPRYGNFGQRQADLDAAETSNIAKAAGELGLTSAEWRTMRAELGRLPNLRDIQR